MNDNKQEDGQPSTTSAAGGGTGTTAGMEKKKKAQSDEVMNEEFEMILDDMNDGDDDQSVGGRSAQSSNSKGSYKQSKEFWENNKDDNSSAGGGASVSSSRGDRERRGGKKKSSKQLDKSSSHSASSSGVSDIEMDMELVKNAPSISTSSKTTRSTSFTIFGGGGSGGGSGNSYSPSPRHSLSSAGAVGGGNKSGLITSPRGPRTPTKYESAFNDSFYDSMDFWADKEKKQTTVTHSPRTPGAGAARSSVRSKFKKQNSMSDLRSDGVSPKTPVFGGKRKPQPPPLSSSSGSSLPKPPPLVSSSSSSSSRRKERPEPQEVSLKPVKPQSFSAFGSANRVAVATTTTTKTPSSTAAATKASPKAGRTKAPKKNSSTKDTSAVTATSATSNPSIKKPPTKKRLAGLAALQKKRQSSFTSAIAVVETTPSDVPSNVVSTPSTLPSPNTDPSRESVLAQSSQTRSPPLTIDTSTIDMKVGESTGEQTPDLVPEKAKSVAPASNDHSISSNPTMTTARQTKTITNDESQQTEHDGYPSATTTDLTVTVNNQNNISNPVTTATRQTKKKEEPQQPDQDDPSTTTTAPTDATAPAQNQNSSSSPVRTTTRQINKKEEPWRPEQDYPSTTTTAPTVTSMTSPQSPEQAEKTKTSLDSHSTPKATKKKSKSSTGTPKRTPKTPKKSKSSSVGTPKGTPRSSRKLKIKDSLFAPDSPNSSTKPKASIGNSATSSPRTPEKSKVSVGGSMSKSPKKEKTTEASNANSTSSYPTSPGKPKVSVGSSVSKSPKKEKDSASTTTPKSPKSPKKTKEDLSSSSKSSPTPKGSRQSKELVGTVKSPKSKKEKLKKEKKEKKKAKSTKEKDRKSISKKSKGGGGGGGDAVTASRSVKDDTEADAVAANVHDLLNHMETSSSLLVTTATVPDNKSSTSESSDNNEDENKSLGSIAEASFDSSAANGKGKKKKDRTSKNETNNNLFASDDASSVSKKKKSCAYPVPLETAPQKSTREGKKKKKHAKFKQKSSGRKKNDKENKTEPVRLKNVQGESLFSPKKSYRPPFFKKSVVEQNMIEKTFKSNPAFTGIVKSTQKALIDAFEKIEFDKGATVAEAGGKEDKLFVVHEGEVSYHNRTTGTQIGTGKAGTAFGEMALRLPVQREVEVKAESDHTVLFQLDHNNYRNILRHQITREEEKRTELLRGVPFFQDVDESDLKQLGAAMKSHNFEEGDNLTASFAEAPFCLVRRGALSIKDLDEDENLDGDGGDGGEGTKIGPGEVFGERILSSNNNGKRLHIQAVSKGIACTITREAFEKVFGDMDRLLGKARDKKILSEINHIKAANLPDKDMDALVRQISNAKYEDGKNIFTIGDDITPALYLVKRGKVEIIKKNGTIEPKVAGEYFGYYHVLTTSEGGHDTVPTSVRAKYTARPVGDTACGILTLQELATFTTVSTKKAPDVEEPTEEEPLFPLEDLVKHRILGEGQFGIVWLVTNKQAQDMDPYALKIQQVNDPSRPDSAALIRKEVSTMKALQCPFIVPIYSTYEDNSSISMLMGLAPGGELFDLVHQEDEDGNWHSGLQEAHASFFATIVADVMAFMHHQKYLYRDLKPENVLIDSDGYPVITDFGFAKRLEGDDSNIKTYTFCGTPQYLCPEITLHRGHSYPADNWTIGVLIYELILGENPFYEPGVDQTILYDSICNKPPFFEDSDPISAEAKDLIFRLLEKDPNKRLGTFREKDILEDPWLSQYKVSKLRAKKVKAPWVPDPMEFEDI